MSAWPESLPQRPLVQGYRDYRADNVLATEMDAGPAKRRMRFTTAPRLITFQMRFTAAQVAIFNTFFDSMLNFGVDSFDLPLAPNFALKAVHFKAHDVPSYVPEGDEAVYSFTIEVDP